MPETFLGNLVSLRNSIMYAAGYELRRTHLPRDCLINGWRGSGLWLLLSKNGKMGLLRPRFIYLQAPLGSLSGFIKQSL